MTHMSSNTDSTTAAFTVAQVMARVGIGRDTVYGLIRDGQLPARKIGRRTVIVASDLETFLRDLPRVGDLPGAA
jgi:excisionase family DNA binding protein